MEKKMFWLAGCYETPNDPNSFGFRLHTDTQFTHRGLRFLVVDSNLPMSYGARTADDLAFSVAKLANVIAQDTKRGAANRIMFNEYSVLNRAFAEYATSEKYQPYTSRFDWIESNEVPEDEFWVYYEGNLDHDKRSYDAGFVRGNDGDVYYQANYHKYIQRIKLS